MTEKEIKEIRQELEDLERRFLELCKGDRKVPKEVLDWFEKQFDKLEKEGPKEVLDWFNHNESKSKQEVKNE